MSDDPKPWQLCPPTPDNIAVVVQTVPQRSQALASTLQSIHRSDIEDVLVVTQQAHQDKQQNLVAALTMLLMSGKDWGIRFEDDVIVNRHILHNICSWSAVCENNFGLGWLFHSHALAAQIDAELAVARSERGNVFRNHPDLVGCLGVLVYTPMIPFIVMTIRDGWQAAGGAQDRAMSRAVWRRGLRVYLHTPPLVEHNVEFESTMAPDRPVIPGLHTTGARFDANWKSA